MRAVVIMSLALFAALGCADEREKDPAPTTYEWPCPDCELSCSGPSANAYCMHGGERLGHPHSPLWYEFEELGGVKCGDELLGGVPCDAGSPVCDDGSSPVCVLHRTTPPPEDGGA